MNHTENAEIGELTREIIGKGFTGLEIEIIPETETNRYGEPEKSFAIVTAADYSRAEDGNISIEAGSLIVALRLVVDAIRFERKEPSLEEEEQANALPSARGKFLCHCGNKSPLSVPSTINAIRFWSTGSFSIDPNASNFKPGEIGTCTECGQRYTFNP
jgi:hypothetical protein